MSNLKQSNQEYNSIQVGLNWVKTNNLIDQDQINPNQIVRKIIRSLQDE